MAKITLGGHPCHTSGSLPEVGTKAPEFNLTTTEFKTLSLEDLKGEQVILNIFPSVDTGVCAQSVRTFNKEASQLDNTKVLCISRDLPFAMARFCGAEGLDNVISLSDFKDGHFGTNYGVDIIDGGFEALLSRAVVVIDTEGTVIYTEQVNEIGEAPNYKAALDALK